MLWKSGTPGPMKGWSTEALGMCKQVSLDQYWRALSLSLSHVSHQIKRTKVLSLFYGNVNVIYYDSEIIATNTNRCISHTWWFKDFSCFVTKNLFCYVWEDNMNPGPMVNNASYSCRVWLPFHKYLRSSYPKAVSLIIARAHHLVDPYSVACLFVPHITTFSSHWWSDTIGSVAISLPKSNIIIHTTST